jgi:diacylglycerol kinase (ATP)
VLVLVNDAAGRIEAETVEMVLSELQADSIDVEVAVCTAESDMDAILDRRRGRTLVVIGGDGSLHTAVTHLWRRQETGSCVVGLIPLGTGNDFARGCGIPLDPLEAARLIRDGNPRQVDLITDNRGEVVVNAVHVGVGADAAVAARPLKPYLKIGAFPLGGIVAGIRSKGWRLKVTVDGVAVATRSRPVLMVGLSNAPTIAGGTALLGPGAVPTDGLIDVTVSAATGYLARMGYALRLLRGAHVRHHQVRYLTATEVSVTGEAFYTNADGEIAGPFTHNIWKIQPGAWRLILPEPNPPHDDGLNAHQIDAG